MRPKPVTKPSPRGAVPACRNRRNGDEQICRAPRGSPKLAAVRSVVSANTSSKLTALRTQPSIVGRSSFEELDKFVRHRCVDFGMQEQRPPADGFVTGFGRIDGRLVYVFAQDFTVFGGSLSETNALKICKIMDLAMRAGAPVIGLNDSGGARIQEGVASLAGLRRYFSPQHACQRSHPADQRHHGPLRGGAVYSPAITDFIFMTRETSYMSSLDPRHQNRYARGSHQAGLGGAMTHNEKVASPILFRATMPIVWP